MTDLKPIHPDRAKELYLQDRAEEVTESTYRTYQYRLKWFSEWCAETEHDDMTDLDGRDLHDYRLWLKQRTDANRTTRQARLSALRVFLRWCRNIDAVEDQLPEKIVLPEREGDGTRDEMLAEDRAQRILSYLERFEYATRDHALFAILWETGMRIGGARTLDLDDFDADNRSLSLVHRPETGTPLKNGADGERMVAISTDVTDLLEDYVEHNRLSRTDEFGREPLFTTKENGRMAIITTRRTAYRWTRPCHVGQECPHDRDPDTCEAAGSYDGASKCPSSMSAHPIRRGAITHFLLADVPQPTVSERMDVSADVLEDHYDERNHKQKMEQRRGYLDNV